MTDSLIDTLVIEKTIKSNFSKSIVVDYVLIDSMPLSRTDVATVFLTNKKQLFVYIRGQSRITLGSVDKYIRRMRLIAEECIPPAGNTGYFDGYGRNQFIKLFPGRMAINEDDIRYYRNLAPYNPALVLIRETKDNKIYGFDSDSSDGWRPYVDFSYRRLKTS